MTHCHACNVDVHPYQHMTESMRFVDACPKCGTALVVAKPAIESATTPPAPSKPAPTAAPQTIEPPDIITMARERLSFVSARIDELRKYEAERNMLKRMLDAADGIEPEQARPN